MLYAERGLSFSEGVLVFRPLVTDLVDPNRPQANLGGPWYGAGRRIEYKDRAPRTQTSHLLLLTPTAFQAYSDFRFQSWSVFGSNLYLACLVGVCSISCPLLTTDQIFRPGCKLVLGSGASAGQEGRFVTAVVGSVATGGGGGGRTREGEIGGGGYVVLEVPVKLDHVEGTRVANGRPVRAETAAYRKRQARRSMEKRGHTI